MELTPEEYLKTHSGFACALDKSTGQLPCLLRVRSCVKDYYFCDFSGLRHDRAVYQTPSARIPERIDPFFRRPFNPGAGVRNERGWGVAVATRPTLQK